MIYILVFKKSNNFIKKLCTPKIWGTLYKRLQRKQVCDTYLVKKFSASAFSLSTIMWIIFPLVFLLLSMTISLKNWVQKNNNKVNAENETERCSQYRIKLKINYQKQDIINELCPICSHATDTQWLFNETLIIKVKSLFFPRARFEHLVIL